MGEDHHPVRVSPGEIEVVERGHRADPPVPDEPPDPVEEVELVADVEVGRRFVEEEQRGLLGQAPGEEQPLPFAPAQLEHARVGPVPKPHLFEGLRRLRTIRRPLAGERREVGESSVQYVVEDAHVVLRGLILGDPGDPEGPRPDGEGGGGRPEEPDGSLR